MKFQHIVPFTRTPTYKVNMPWDGLERTIQRYTKEYGLNLDPEFQRAHVWTEEQQVRYVVYILRQGASGRDIYFNHPGWMRGMKGQMLLVDGKQRLEAVRSFLRGDLELMGGYRFGDFTDSLPFSADFIFHVNDLKTYAAVLRWYIDLNQGGTVHTDAEIAKVRELLLSEQQKAGSA